MKKWMLLILTLAIALGAAGCGKAKTVDAQALSSALSGAEIYDDILTQLPEDMARRFYGMDEGELTAGILYYGTGATAEEIAILQCRDEAAADKALENAKARIEAQKTSFADYRPSEVPKLDSAVLQKVGLTVIVVVSADAARAQEIVDQYIQ